MAIINPGNGPLPPDTWHGKHTYLSTLEMLGTTHLNSTLFADHITFNNGYMHTRQRKPNNNNNTEEKV